MFKRIVWLLACFTKGRPSSIWCFCSCWAWSNTLATPLNAILSRARPWTKDLWRTIAGSRQLGLFGNTTNRKWIVRKLRIKALAWKNGGLTILVFIIAIISGFLQFLQSTSWVEITFYTAILFTFADLQVPFTHSSDFSVRWRCLSLYLVLRNNAIIFEF